LKRLRKSVIYFAAINLFLGISISGGTHLFGSGISIDNMAHIGGFSCGLLFATPMVPRLGSPRRLFVGRLRISVTMVVACWCYLDFSWRSCPDKLLMEKG